MVIDFCAPFVRSVMLHHAYAMRAGRSKLLVQIDTQRDLERLERVGYPRRYCLEQLQDLVEQESGRGA